MRPKMDLQRNHVTPCSASENGTKSERSLRSSSALEPCPRACCDAFGESLRVRTILPFVVRLTKRPFVAGGREYPPGVMLSPCDHLVHRRPDLYPEPDKFRPERFLERKYAAHEWFPFGGGNRVCLGMAFALYEMKVVLSMLFDQVRLTRPPGAHSAPVRRGISLAPDDGARMVVAERLKR